MGAGHAPVAMTLGRCSRSRAPAPTAHARWPRPEAAAPVGASIYPASIVFCALLITSAVLLHTSAHSRSYFICHVPTRALEPAALHHKIHSPAGGCTWVSALLQSKGCDSACPVDPSAPTPTPPLQRARELWPNTPTPPPRATGPNQGYVRIQECDIE